MKTRSEAKREKDYTKSKEKLREWTIDVPNDPINEQVILAAMIADGETRQRLSKTWAPEAFYADEHRAIFTGLVELSRRKLEYDPATLMRLVPDVDIRILETLASSRPDLPDNLDFHVETLTWDAQRARVTRGPLASLLEAVQNPKESPDRVKAFARAVGDSFEGAGGTGRFLRDPKEVVRQAMSTLKRRVAGEAYYPFGIEGLDYYENGVRRIRPGASPGTISMVTALSGSGKSTLTGHLILGSARQNLGPNKVRRKVLCGAWEEEAPVTIELLATLSLGMSRSRILDGQSNRIREDSVHDYEPLSNEDLVMIEECMHGISKYVTFFDNPFQHGKLKTGRNPTNDDHLNIIQEHLEDSGCDIWFADLFARCLIDDSPSAEKSALYRLLSITQEQAVHTVIVHQQRAKDIETRPDKRPTREGIIGSGAWLDICWTVMAPHLPAKWKRVPDNTMELYLLKQRNGPWPIAIEFDWVPDTGQISNGRSLEVKAIGESDEIGGGFNVNTKRGKRR
jgi:replicative DNA helicase